MRRRVREMLRQSLMDAATEMDSVALGRSALIFAPHPDDETLACGGTIIKKLQAGANVAVAVMTDGRHSHAQWMDESQLAARREREALAAARILGLAEADVHFLRFEDGRLQTLVEQAVAPAVELLARYEPEEVYIPLLQEPPPDHVATNHIVRAALRQVGVRPNVYEYPVWFWQHWPWTGLPGDSWRSNALYARRSAAFGFGRAARHFNAAVFVGDVLAQKRAALEAHASQTARPSSVPSWPILADVSGGEWLSLCLQPYELFAVGSAVETAVAQSGRSAEALESSPAYVVTESGGKVVA